MRLLGYLAPTLLRSSTTSHHRAQARAGALSSSIANHFTGLGHPARFRSALSHAIQSVWCPSLNRCVLWHYVSAFMPLLHSSHRMRPSLIEQCDGAGSFPGRISAKFAVASPRPRRASRVWPPFFIFPAGLGIICASSGAERLWFGRHFGKKHDFKARVKYLAGQIEFWHAKITVACKFFSADVR